MTIQLSRRRLLQAACGAAPAMFAPSWLRAETPYPGKPIIVKVAFPAGGPADESIRAAAVVMKRSLGQNVIADNVPGEAARFAR
jgi:tripartite-type tricarboxylate transporter receptor subunit TctC